MGRRGRYLAGCLTAALAAASGGPLAAAPPFPAASPFPPANTPLDASGPAIVPGPSGGRSSDKPFEGFDVTRRFQAVEQNGSIGGPQFRREAPASPAFPPSITARPTYETPAQPAPTMPAQAAAAPAAAPQQSSRWVTVFGDVDRPGSYGLAGETISIGELIGRCGIDRQSEGTLLLVRNGRPFGQIYNPKDLLLPGDVIIAQASSPDARLHVQLGLVNMIDRPIAVMVPASLATVSELLKLTNQTHLSARDVTVLVGGSESVPGDQVGELTSGSVLVFDARTINTAALPELRTNYYPATDTAPAAEPIAGPTSAALVSGSVSANMAVPPALPVEPPQPAPSVALSEIDPFEGMNRLAQRETAVESTSAQGPPSPLASPDDKLSQLPAVEVLDAPAASGPMQFPRTADASGRMPIGGAESDPHIVPVPTDILSEAAQNVHRSRDRQPVATRGIAASDLPPDDAEQGTGPSFGDLLPTVLVGGLLGFATFFALRRLRGSGLMDRAAAATVPAIERLRNIPNRFLAKRETIPTDAKENEPQFEAITTVAEEIAAERIASESVIAPPAASERTPTAPADMLAALIADRLARREEPIVLPASMRIDGRTSSLVRRRIDLPETEVNVPHVATAATLTPTVEANASGDASENRSHISAEAGKSFRLDPAEPVRPPVSMRSTDTPFERALAALQARG